MAQKPSKSDNPPQKTVGTDIVEAIRGELINDVSTKKADALSERISQLVISEYFSGPLPHPRHLAQYDDIIPDGADRVMKMAERSLDHSITQKEARDKHDAEDRKTGMKMGFACFVLLIASAFIVMMTTESEVGAGLFLAAAAVNVIGLFINGRAN